MWKQAWELLVGNPEIASALGTVFSAITALIALVATFWGLQIQRRHNALSVTPKASFMLGNYEDDIYVKLINNGIGPLIVKNFHVRKDGQQYSSIIATIGREFEGVVFRDFVGDINERVIPAGQEIVLIRYQPRHDNRNDQLYKHNLRNHLARLECFVEYTDLYGRSHPIVSGRFSI